MKINYLGKSRLSVVIVLSAASVAFAQKTKDSINSKEIEQVVLVGRNLASVAKERKTPVAISTIRATEIQEKLGNREFPEIAKSTPSVYVTKTGGGYGDGRINIRGFDNSNIAVIINGQPVNDMENGRVYWSNWTGLADIASSLQIQRGLGASKLVVPSVGGTFNVVTKATDNQRGGFVKADAGNDFYHRLTASYSTGMNEKGWATTVLLSRWAGNGYIQGTAGEGYTWFISTGYKASEKHQFNFTATGAPQVHDTRRDGGTGTLRGTTLDLLAKYGPKFNPQFGYLEGKEFTTSPNFYHKPIASFNWDWAINDALKLSTVVYGSWGRGGGGTGVVGGIARNSAGKTINIYTKDGLINYDILKRYNKGILVTDIDGNSFQKNTYTAPTGSVNTAFNGKYVLTSNDGYYRQQGVNSHDWYGAIMDLNYKPSSNWSFNGGIDLRSYRGIHYNIATDLLGADAVYSTSDKNTQGVYITDVVTPSPLANYKNNQKVTYDYDGLVRWAGAYGQIEYSNKSFSTFIQASGSNQAYKRVDRFLSDPTKRETDWNAKWGYILKTGANFNIDSHHNVFFNAGLISRQPNFSAVYPNNGQKLNPNLTNERIFSVEAGYGLKTKYVDVNLNAYRTQWDDRFLSRSFRASAADVTFYNDITLVPNTFYTVNSLGLGQLHQGVELETRIRPTSFLKLRGMVSYGDWKYKGNATYDIVDQTTLQAMNSKSYTMYVDGLKVGDAAQTTASAGFDLNITKQFSVDANWEYYDRLYAQFNPTFFKTSTDRDKGIVKLPSYHLLDAGATFKVPMRDKKELVLRANVYNVLNKVYISELFTNVHATSTSTLYNGIDATNQGFVGFGRTWSASATFRF